MRNFWLVAKHEYLKIAWKKSFLLGTLGMPFIIVMVSAISILVAVGQRGELPLGYVDQAGVLGAIPAPAPEDDINFIVLQSYDTPADARTALENKELQGYFIIPEDYTNTGHVELFYLNKRPSELAQADFENLIQMNLIAHLPFDIQIRLVEGATVTVRAADGSREFDSANILNFIVPYIAAFLFIIAVLSAGGYMLQAITDEKENRTIEILATSLRPMELIAGKAFGLMSVGLTQLTIWAGTGILALLGVMFFIEDLPTLSIPWSFVLVAGVFFLPTYALLAGMMTAIGSVVTDLRQGQQISGILNMLFNFPFFFLILIIEKPDHPIVTVLTLFPTTSFITLMMRWAVTTVPLWQLSVSFLLLVSSAIFSVWVAARLFRLGMLRYGQRLNMKNIVNALRPTRGLKPASEG